MDESLYKDSLSTYHIEEAKVVVIMVETALREMEKDLFSLDVFSKPGMNSEKEAVLHDKSMKDMRNLTVLNDKSNPYVQKAVLSLIDSHRKIDRYLAKEGVKPPEWAKYLEVTNEPNVYPLFVFANDGLHVLPSGHWEAFRDDSSDLIGVDEGTIYGSPKNVTLRELYKEAKREALKLADDNPRIRKPLHKLARHYDNLHRALSNPNHLERVLVHEGGHTVQYKIKNERMVSVANQLKRYDGEIARQTLEGLNEVFTDEVAGPRDSYEDSYGQYTKNMYKALRNRGMRAVDAFKFANVSIAAYLADDYKQMAEA